MQNHEAVTRFALRGAPGGRPGPRPVAAPLCDPTAIPAMEHQAAADAGETLLSCLAGAGRAALGAQPGVALEVLVEDGWK